MKRRYQREWIKAAEVILAVLIVTLNRQSLDEA
jgi:hypothetical protein